MKKTPLNDRLHVLSFDKDKSGPPHASNSIALFYTFWFPERVLIFIFSLIKTTPNLAQYVSPSHVSFVILPLQAFCT